jgi:hypothetical protein
LKKNIYIYFSIFFDGFDGVGRKDKIIRELASVKTPSKLRQTPSKLRQNSVKSGFFDVQKSDFKKKCDFREKVGTVFAKKRDFFKINS